MPEVSENSKRKRNDDGVTEAAGMVNRMDKEDVADLREWMSALGSQELRIQVIRIEPRVWKGVTIEGTLETFDELFDEDFLKEKFGGGKYRLVVTRRDKDGRMKYVTATRVRISGPPKTEWDSMTGMPMAMPGSDGNGGVQLASRAMDTAERLLKEERAAKASNGVDHGLIQAMQAPLLEQLRGLQAQSEAMQERLAAKEAQVLEIISRPAPTPAGSPFQERILEKMVDGESSRIEALRTQHDSELRQLKQSHEAQLDRERDRLKDDMRSREKQHEREIDTLNRANQLALDSQKTAFETRIDGLKAEVARLQSEMAALKTEMAELRARKEKSLPEQAEEIVKVRDALKAISGDDDEDGDSKSPWYEKAISGIMENPGAIGELLGGVRGAVGPTPEQQQQAALEQQQQHQILLAQQQHQARLAARKRKARVARAPQPVDVAPEMPTEDGSAPAPPPAPAARSAPLKPPDANDVRMAITFMESACSNGTAPETFAASVRSAIPQDTLTFIQKVGVDRFMEEVHMDGDSILRTQRGRNWVRGVFKALLGG